MHYLISSPFKTAVIEALDSNTIVALTDRQGVILHVNETFCRISGYSADELLGKTHRVVKSGVHSAAFMRELWQTILAGNIWRGEICNRRKDGSLYWVKTVITPMPDATGEIEAFLAIRQDITELKKAQEHLQGIIDGLPGMVGYWDTNLRNCFANKIYLDWLGKLPQEIHGIHLRELLGEERFELNRPHFEKALQGESQIFERMIPRADGTARWTQVYYIPDNQAGKIVGFFEFVFDISVIKDAELRAKEANEAKNRFLSNISHELRTPFNGIMGFAQLVSMSSEAPANLLAYGGHIEASAEHMLSLINELLDFSRIEAGVMQMEPEQTTLENVLNTVVELIALQAKSKQLDFVTDILLPKDTRLYVDVKRLRQILLNLLANAVKFTERGRVLLRISADADRLSFEIHDQGVGIHAADIPRLFTPFSQVGDQSLRSQGLGLGLAISQQLAKAMGGEITVSSAPGAGSIFAFSLPLLAESAAIAVDQPPSGLVARTARQKILYVEDDPRGRELMREFLRSWDVELHLAENAQTALDLAQNTTPDLVLLDLILPDMSGFDLLGQMRSTAWGAATPVVAVSADSVQPTVERAFASGVADFVAKPIDLHKLQIILSRYASRTG